MGGCIVEHIDTGSLMFLPGSQISDKPLKDISHLMNEPQKFALIKMDKVRGNACVSRRQIISSSKKEDKAKIIEKYKVGDVIKNAIVKGYSSFGCFFNVNNEIDCLVHLQEISYSRVSHPEEIFTIGDKHDLLVISVDKEKLQVGCSIKQLSPDPFEKITNYELIEMHAGEEFKNIKTCEKIWHKLTEKGADRNSILINLGGGVVCDLGGFVACTFKRGIDFYNIPTTLLSMVDASVGGKTGIDLGSLKNQIGIFKEPKEVIIDSNWLKTLQQEEIRSGFAEMLKHGLIASASYWDKLKKINLLSISNLTLLLDAKIILNIFFTYFIYFYYRGCCFFYRLSSNINYWPIVFSKSILSFINLFSNIFDICVRFIFRFF